MTTSTTTRSSVATLEVARAMVAGGVSLIPIRVDGTKGPAVPEWTTYQGRLPTEDELERWFARPAGIAAVCGAVSRNMEVIDIDSADLVQPYRDEVERLRPGLIEKLVEVRSPRGGAHLHYRHVDIPMGSKPLARRPITGDTGKPALKILIETRGEKSLVTCPGSPAGCHANGGVYTLTRGDLAHPPLLSIASRLALIEAAWTFNEYDPPAPTVILPHLQIDGDGDRPGDRFNAEADWGAVLGPHGWQPARVVGTETYWVKPGADPHAGHHATTGYQGLNIFRMFSTAAFPFEAERSYTPFAAYALLEHGGDYTAAARSLGGSTHENGAHRQGVR